MYLPTSAGVLVILSMTGPEAVGKYIYVSERPPGNIISSFNQKSLKSRFFHAPPSMSYKKTRHFHDFYDEHSPYASCNTSTFGYFSNF